MRPLAPLRSAPPSHDFPGENCAVWFAMVYGMVWYGIVSHVPFALCEFPLMSSPA